MRTFIAVELPEKIKSEIEQLQAPFKKTDTFVSWVKPKNIHVTLKFLGEVPEERMNEVFSATEKALEGTRKFTMSLRGTGAFPNPRRPRVIWVGAGSGGEELSQMAVRIEQEMEKIGFPKEKRKYSAHFTIGRVKSPKNIEKLMELVSSSDFQTEEIEVNEVVVMKSQLDPGGAIYTPLKKIPLVG
ncbi:MAG: RNA 2',3'-cyclic phosphodiesterase [Candidatus Zixiibacteriota bacterium]|jgi:2'-5' RNA ligase